jgi:predicted DNA-binding protein with PD1-like motif
MRSKVVWQEAGARTIVLVLDPGEEAFQTISDFAAAQAIEAASLTALGAFSAAKVGWFDFAKHVYDPIAVNEQCEALSLIGDIARGDDGKPSLHVHAVLGLRDGTTRGGHLLEATVKPTLEVTLVETPAHLRRRKRPEFGIALIDLD